MKRIYVFLILIVLLGAVLRIYSAFHIPASGDEIVSLIQSSGKAHLYPLYHQQHMGVVIPREDLLWFLEYSDDEGLRGVAESLEQAGMHPPLYYFLLHCVLKYLGSDPFLLRCVSIMFSLGSVLFVYLIGREL
jgi:uncharacterized membrane protein